MRYYAMMCLGGGVSITSAVLSALSGHAWLALSGGIVGGMGFGACAIMVLVDRGDARANKLGGAMPASFADDCDSSGPVVQASPETMRWLAAMTRGLPRKPGDGEGGR